MNKNMAYIDFKIVPNHFVHGQSALVGCVGFAGEYSVAFNPNSGKFETAFFPEGRVETLAESDNLNDAVSALNEKFYVACRQDELFGELEREINRAMAEPKDFEFYASCGALSGSPAITFEGERGLIYIAFETDFHVGIYGDGDNIDEDSFRTINEAKVHLEEKYKVRVSDRSKREMENFLTFVRATTPA